MLNIDNILLASDFSASADEAIPFAIMLAERTGARLHSVYVESLFGGVLDPHPVSRNVKLRGRMTEAFVPDTSTNFVPGGISIDPVIARGIAPAPAILDYAKKHDIDLIMMGTHGRRGVQRLLLGSVAEEIVRLSPCPVLTIRRDKQEKAAEQASVDSITVPVDFSVHAREALRHAKALAKLVDARLDLLHVVEENLHPAFYGPTVQSIYDIDPDLDEKALARMIDFYQRTEGPDTEVTFSVRSGHAVQEILQFADETSTDLIVMGTHGLTGIERFFMGSVTEKVVRRAPCPVFTLKSFGKSLVQPQAQSELASTEKPKRLSFT